MNKYDLAYRFREAFGHKTTGRVGERLEPIDKLLAKLKAMKVPRTRIGYTSIGRTNGTFLKLHLTNVPGEAQSRVLYFNAEQELVKGQ